MATRFSPSQIDPSTVRYIDSVDLHEDEFCWVPLPTRQYWTRNLAPESKRNAGLHRCDVCGASLRYAVIFAMDPTGEFFVTGEDCAENLELAGEWGVKVTALRKQAATNNQNRKFAAKAQQVLDADPMLGAFFALDNDFARDLFDYLYSHGTLTDGQVQAAYRSLDREAERIARAEADAARPHVDCPAGRIEVVGEVVGLKQVDGYAYGTTEWKITVVDDRGFKVFGTLPRSLRDEFYDRWYAGKQEQFGEHFFRGDYGPDCWTEQVKGSRVAFTATLEAGKRDPEFGFFKRPVKARLVESVQA